MSYTLKWALSGPDVFKIGNIYIKSDDNDGYSNAWASGIPGRSSLPIFRGPTSTTISLKRCDSIDKIALANLQSFLHIPFPPFYIVEEGKKSAIGVGWDEGTAITTRLFNMRCFYGGINANNPSYDLDIVTCGNIQYIVQPQAKFDTIEFSLGVVEKPKKSKYIEVSNGERSIIISRRKNGKRE